MPSLGWGKSPSLDSPLPAPGRRNNTRCFPSHVFSLLGSDKEYVFHWFLWKLLHLQNIAHFTEIIVSYFTNGSHHLEAGGTNGWLASPGRRAITAERLRPDSWLVRHLLVLQKVLGSFQSRVGKTLKFCEMKKIFSTRRLLENKLGSSQSNWENS